MKTIPLTQGYETQVSDDKYDKLMKHKWCVDILSENNIYAKRAVCNKEQCITIRMHREIMKVVPGMQIDHRDGNGLNNQTENLRICTKDENNRNRRKIIGSSSKYKGVYWHGVAKKWMVSIEKNNDKFYLGLFKSEIDAAKVYNITAVKLFGEFAKLNIIDK